MYDIFINYHAPTDSPWVSQLCLRLKQSGADVWIDAVRIRHGEPRTEAIWAGMMTSQVMVLVVTPEAIADDAVTWQWTQFLDSGRPVLPVILHETRLPAPLRHRYYVDFFNQDFESAFQQLCNVLSLWGIVIPSPRTLLPAQTSTQKSVRLGWSLHSKSKEVHQDTGVRAILPPPFTWIEIPGGQVTLIPSEHDREYSYLKRKTTFRVTPFAIAKYPITNAQYALFVKAGGYDEPQWWTTAGWESRVRRNRTEPLYWHDPKFNASGQPVVGVSWYEAVAFCRWLSAMSGETVMLPTEQQWQWAAQGKHGWCYPWGNGWNGTRCNNTVPPQHSEGTTWVRQYEKIGDSPFGVVDMVGNAEEWCLTGYHIGSASVEGTEQRMARGGCWRDEWPADLLVTHRNLGGLCPEGVSDFIGFRCVRLG